jgi:hypothetical protein
MSESNASLADRMLKELQQRHQGASKYGDLEFPLTASYDPLLSLVGAGSSSCSNCSFDAFPRMLLSSSQHRLASRAQQQDHLAGRVPIQSSWILNKRFQR